MGDVCARVYVHVCVLFTKREGADTGVKRYRVGKPGCGLGSDPTSAVSALGEGPRGETETLRPWGWGLEAQVLSVTKTFES